MKFGVVGRAEPADVDDALAERFLREAKGYRIHVFLHYYKEAFLYDTIWNYRTEKDVEIEPEDIVLTADLKEIYGFRRQADRMKDGVREARVDYLLPEQAGAQEIRYDSKVYFDDFYEFNTYYVYSLKKV